ncbi:MAG: NAD(P)H-dependent oxidoreductase [Alphaproteobacteria bacterium]|uniref:NADPH-dependent FMN reductase n=1 Tax=Brevundimonas sp. BAL3 TaxID=391600 RepID=UPI00017ED485|nr:NAD(P)H-dependent oxidoreductase [Brevundimonas sp. BAL3]EDX81591.1 NADPH-dependent FMN reductase, putative [Brevundimonas sp. BAL3]PZO09172.1 MAG: NAD(P)H-dependent oxidoreductase [Alphaproteobacteria bacterium]
MYTVAVFVGSLRRESANLKLAKALQMLGSDVFAFRYPDLNLPLYNDDLWETPPAGVLTMKEEIASADAVLFVTPEYNRSVPPVLKNAIDWASRPWGQNSWAGKPTGIVGASPGLIGSAVAQSHLRSIMLTQESIIMGQPEVYFSRPTMIDADGTVTDEEAAAFLKTYVDRFAAWVGRMRDNAA